MIGETIKIGFDGTAVKRGLAGIMGGFSKLRTGVGRVTRQVGIGAARQTGATLLGIGVNLATAIPREISALSDLRQELFALGDATGVTEENLIALRQAIAKTSNISPDMASKVMKELSQRIGLAQKIGSTEFKGFQDMGLSPVYLKGMNIIDQLEEVANAYQKIRKARGIEAANASLRDTLGSRLGKDLAPLLLNFGDAMEKAGKDTAFIGQNMKALKGELDAIDDIQIAFSNKISEIALGALHNMKAVGLDMRSIAGFIESLDFGKDLKKISSFIKSEIDKVKSMGIWEWIESTLKRVGDFLSQILSNAFSKAITNISEALNNSDVSLMSLFMGDKSGMGKFLTQMNKSSDNKTARDTSSIEKNTAVMANTLNKIARNGNENIAVYGN